MVTEIKFYMTAYHFVGGYLPFLSWRNWVIWPQCGNCCFWTYSPISCILEQAISMLWSHCIWKPSEIQLLSDQQSKNAKIIWLVSEKWLNSVAHHSQLFDSQYISYHVSVCKVIIHQCLLDGLAFVNIIQANVIQCPEQWIEWWCHENIAVRVN